MCGVEGGGNINVQIFCSDICKYGIYFLLISFVKKYKFLLFSHFNHVCSITAGRVISVCSNLENTLNGINYSSNTLR